ncbi:MAG: chorismate mutase [Alkalispirochaeta sp.]
MSNKTDATTKLTTHRETLDRLDAALVYLLAERFSVTETIGQLKAELDLAPLDAEREREQLARLQHLAEDAGLQPHYLERVFREITGMVRARHEEIRQQRRSPR